MCCGSYLVQQIHSENAQAAQAATQSLVIFVHVPDVIGDVTVKEYYQWIQASSYGASGFNTCSGGAAPNNIRLAITKPIDRSSPFFSLKAVSGEEVSGPVQISILRKTGQSFELLMEIELKGRLYVRSIETSIQQGGSQTTETIEFCFTEITWIYYPTSGSSIKKCWDLQSNLDCSPSS
jgi:type VI secretion system Hcp family effector